MKKVPNENVSISANKEHYEFLHEKGLWWNQITPHDALNIHYSPLTSFQHPMSVSRHHHAAPSINASVEHHGVQPTGCIDDKPEPSRGVPC